MVGFQQTDIGLIPEDWKVRTIGDYFDFKNGLNKEKYFFGHGTPIVNYMDVFNNLGITKRVIKGLVSVNNDEIRNYEVRKGDVFFTRTSETTDEIGITSVVLEKLEKTVFSGFILRGRPKNNELSIGFKKYCFSSDNVRKEIVSKSSYTTRALTNGTLLSNVLIPLPPFQEQEAIAEVLSDTDELIGALEKRIAKKRLIKQGAMQTLLAPKDDWEVKKLGEISKMSSGGTPSSKVLEYYDGKIIWVSISDITDAGKFIGNSTKKITEKGLVNSSAKIFPKDTVLLAMYASIGKCCIATQNLTTSQAILGIETKKLIINEFLYYYLVFHKQKLVSQGQQGTQSNLNKGMVQDLDINLPSISEQTRIATILSDMDNEIKALEKKLAKTKELKQGLMQQLLTGKIRLV